MKIVKLLAIKILWILYFVLSCVVILTAISLTEEALTKNKMITANKWISEFVHFESVNNFDTDHNFDFQTEVTFEHPPNKYVKEGQVGATYEPNLNLITYYLRAEQDFFNSSYKESVWAHEMAHAIRHSGESRLFDICSYKMSQIINSLSTSSLLNFKSTEYQRQNPNQDLIVEYDAFIVQYFHYLEKNNLYNYQDLNYTQDIHLLATEYIQSDKSVEASILKKYFINNISNLDSFIFLMNYAYPKCKY